MPKPWVPHVIQQGEHVRKLAYRYGVSAETVWSHEKNQEISKLRKNMDLLCPGDVVHLPSEPLPPLPLDVGSSNQFKAKVPKIHVKVHLEIPERKLAGQRFEVHGVSAKGEPISGTVGAEGDIAFDVRVLVREVEIRLPDAGIILPMMIGDLDPIDEPSGIVQRLRNLGYLPPSGEVDENAVTAGLRAFQHANDLPDTGALDEATKKAIEDQHLL